MAILNTWCTLCPSVSVQGTILAFQGSLRQGAILLWPNSAYQTLYPWKKICFFQYFICSCHNPCYGWCWWMCDWLAWGIYNSIPKVVCTLLWNFIVRQVKFIRFLHPQNDCLIIARAFDWGQLKIGHFQYSEVLIKAKNKPNLPWNHFLTSISTY